MSGGLGFDEVRIRTPREGLAPRGTSRVVADVAGHEVFFESRDVRLEPRPEAFAEAFFVPSLAWGARLAVDAGLDPIWLGNHERLLPILEEWWGLRPSAAIAHHADSANLASQEPIGREQAACFTGGVDSFHALLRAAHAAEALLFMQGFDISVDDDQRMAEWEPRFRRISEASARRAIVIRTNVRQHPLFNHYERRGRLWMQGHGGVLAAAGHTLPASYGSLFVAATYTLGDPMPWGSHWRTDALRSSSRLQVVHGDGEMRRPQKLWEMLDEPLVREHLRVCMANPRLPAGNCSRCEKCVRTMIALCARGALEASSVFGHSRRLVDRVDLLERLRRDLQPTYLDHAADEALPADIRAAIARLLERSRAPQTAPRVRSERG